MLMRILSLTVIAFVFIAMPAISSAQPRRHGMYEGTPYGQFCPGMRGDPYGVRKPVRKADEAKQVLEEYFEGSGQKVRLGNVEERRWFFIIEVRDSEGSLIDKAIVDKRTGRIRSIY
jgi:hypothetical protein